MLDFSNEAEQRKNCLGPVPAGSIVLLEIEVLKPYNSAPENSYISVAKTGLRQLYCKCTVTAGTYEGWSFRQNVTLNVGSQRIVLTEGQTTACKIGGSLIKAICQAAQKPLTIMDVTELTGYTFPAKVKISPIPYMTNDGRAIWNNEISLIITPQMPEYVEVCSRGEIINVGGAVTGNRNLTARNNTRSTDVDEVPFN